MMAVYGMMMMCELAGCVANWYAQPYNAVVCSVLSENDDV